MKLFEARGGIGLDGLEDELVRAFAAVRLSIDRDGGVAIAVDDEHLGGAGGNVEEAALAHGLLGLARAVAFEGSKAGWTVAVIAHETGSRVDDWVEHLEAGGSAANGVLLRLGGGHLGRLPT